MFSLFSRILVSVTLLRNVTLTLPLTMIKKLVDSIIKLKVADQIGKDNLQRNQQIGLYSFRFTVDVFSVFKISEAVFVASSGETLP